MFSFLLWTATIYNAQSATIYKTAQNTTDRLTPYNIQFVDDNSVQNPDVLITINTSLTYQQMRGIGGAFTPTSSYLFSKLNQEKQQEILSMYFSDTGNKYNMARLTIGSCDFSPMSYNFDPYPNDYDLIHFNLTEYDYNYILPFIHQSLTTFLSANYSNYTDFMFIASPWSPPGWMKDNGEMTCGISTCERCKLKDDDKIHITYTNYLSKYIDSYETYLNYKIFGITPQNEPYACPEFYEGMHFNPRTEGKFIEEYLGPIFQQNHPDLNIYIYDQNKGGMLKWLEQIIVNNTDAAKYVKGTAVHWYDGDHFNILNASHYLAPNYEILATEATVAYDHKDIINPSWSKAEHYGHDMIGDFNNFVVGFIDWNLLLDEKGGPDHAGPNLCESDVVWDCGSDSMLIVDTVLNEIYAQIFYYYVGHFSRFMEKNDFRIDWKIKNITNNNIDIELTAFYNKKKDVTNVIIMNPTDNIFKFQLKDERNKYNGLSLNGTLQPHSMQTVVY